MEDKKRVTGIGGIFFKSKDVEAVNAWYGKHLGLTTTPYGTTFEWLHVDAPDRKGSTVWSAFKDTTKYFEPSTQPFMINYRVEDLVWLVERLKEEGVTIVGEIQEFPYGKFVHIMDPEGNKIELWEAQDEHL